MNQRILQRSAWLALLFACSSLAQFAYAEPSAEFLKRYCFDCHGPTAQEAGLDLSALPRDYAHAEHFRRWQKVYDRVREGEMPPAEAEQPKVEERRAWIGSLSEALVAAERAAPPKPHLRRLTRAEYEHTIRDLFEMPGIALLGNLPADGSAHGFDKHTEALDISHVNLAKYLEAADHILNYAIATRPQPPVVQKRRISLVNRGGFVAHVVMNGDGVLLKDKRPDPEFPPAAAQNHLDQGAHEKFGSFENGATVGLFRHEDESFSPYFIEHVTIYPGQYRVRTSLWGFQWDKGQVLPGRGTEAARLSVVQLTGDGRGGQHPSYVLGYFDAPADHAREHEVSVWLNHNELIGFNTASLAPAANYSRPGRAMAFTGPGIACDWLDIEGPLHEVWPPRSHQRLFGDLPLTEFRQEEHPNVRPPARPKVRQLGAGMNRPDPEPGLWTVTSASPREDAERLLANFLPQLFRRPVAAETTAQYVAIVMQRLDAGDCFETAMRAAYKAALCAPDFLYHVESSDAQGALDNHTLACRLSYFLWNSLPDEKLWRLAATGELRQPEVLTAEIERLLSDPKSERFIEDFLGQWLKLRQIAANDPDKKLYPEFSPYLQDAMIAETRAYFRELLDGDLDAAHLVKSNFVMLNERLAKHYGIANVEGCAMRRVPLAADVPRGGFLTQASILKITANGTTTSPVPRGAFVIDRLLGQPPEPPPAAVAAIEPDVRGATTIREQLAKHREHAVCASCHKRIDPPGFALEAFDVIGGYRQRYRSIGEGDAAERGAIDPFIGISFKLGPPVDASGELADGRTFADIREYQTLLAAESTRLLRNLATQLAIYATGREVRFSDRPAIEAIVERTKQRQGGVRTLLHELIASPLFTGGAQPLDLPRTRPTEKDLQDANESTRLLMTSVLPSIEKPLRTAPPEQPLPESQPFDAASAPTLTLPVFGLFMPERVDAFRAVMAEVAEAKLLEVNFDTAQAKLAYDAESQLLRGATPEQVVERLNNRVRQGSRSLFGLQSPSSLPREKLELVEIPIVGLDCPACSLAAYEILARVDGVEQATANFRTGRATAWIDPARTDRAKLVQALEQRQVKVGER